MKDDQELHQLMRQYYRENGSEWQKFLKSIQIKNLHGWDDQEIIFQFPVVAIVGENGIGKSTFLKAAACAYQNEAGKDFYPSNMFLRTRWDDEGMRGACIIYKVKQGNQDLTLRWKKSKDWTFSPKANKPKRAVYFLDISRTLPLDATAGYAKIAKLASTEAGDGTEFTDESLASLSNILGHHYTKARFASTDIREDREIGLLTNSHGEISQFHQGAGEDSMMDMLKLFQSIPNQSLLIIDEVENSLHPQAQRRLVKELIHLALKKKAQIILSTHSPFILEELPPAARVMLYRLSDHKDVLYEISTDFALSTIDENRHPEFYIYLEDEEAEVMFWELLRQNPEKYDSYRKRIETRTIGSCEVVAKMNDLAKTGKLPVKVLCLFDGDQQKRDPSWHCLPGTKAPEKQVLEDLKERKWLDLDAKFEVGAGSLFKILDDALLQKDHHTWTEYIGDKIRLSKSEVWHILVKSWCKECLPEEDKAIFYEMIDQFIQSSDAEAE